MLKIKKNSLTYKAGLVFTITTPIKLKGTMRVSYLEMKMLLWRCLTALLKLMMNLLNLEEKCAIKSNLQGDLRLFPVLGPL